MLCCRKRLMLRVARYLQYDKVAVGDTSSVLAARVLSFIAQGRGAQLSHEMVCDVSYACSDANPLKSSIHSLYFFVLAYDGCTRKWDIKWVLLLLIMTKCNFLYLLC